MMRGGGKLITASKNQFVFCFLKTQNTLQEINDLKTMIIQTSYLNGLIDWYYDTRERVSKLHR